MPAKGQKKATATKRSKQQRAYNSTPEQKKRRAQRNKARAQMEKEGKVKKGDGKDVDHKDKNTSNNSKGNLRVKSKSANRADNRGTGGRKKKGNR
jgi:hypothetical protein